MQRGDYQKYEFSTACAAYGAKGKKLGNIDTQLLSEVWGIRGEVMRLATKLMPHS
ncbi:hypothetical protein D3C74_171580 [compost metagenome]